MEALDLYAKWVLGVFILGYVLITIEHLIKVDKATTALLTGIICWVIEYAHASPFCADKTSCLNEHLSNIAQIVFFLLGALAIVELINVHQGFTLISNNLTIRSKRKLMWVICGITFFLSAVLDNLTTTIVMVTLLQKLVDRSDERLIIGGGVVIAANAGGAWTPIGDVTTTMLWIGGELTTIPIMRDLFLPSLFSMLVAIFLLSFMLKGEFPPIEIGQNNGKLEPMGSLIFVLGIAALIFVPIFKISTGLPPFMGVLFGLSILWVVADLVHRGHPERDHLRVTKVFSRIDFSGLMFFVGILLAINALDTAGILGGIAHWLSVNIGNTAVIATVIGLASAIVDNVPLVAASMGMYSLDQYPPDHSFWQLIAFCAGTGGSILVIGSAAGVVFMGLEKVDFLWYIRRISLSAIVGYFAGIGLYLMLVS